MKNPRNPLIFIVEDDIAYLTLTKNELENLGYKNLKTFSSGEECMKSINLKPDIVLLDYALSNEMNGLEVLKRIKKQSHETQVIMLTAYDKLEIAIDSIKSGAYDYVLKSETTYERIANLFRKIIRQNELSLANKQLELGKKIVLIILLVLIIATTLIYYFFPGIF
ncbi:MAG: response regulator [Bacteroidales bacterium]|nr:response regulator [Bacteroidales bacterium]